MHIKRILFPTDFSSLSNYARDYAITMAKTFQASVHILHAIEPISVSEREVDDEIEKFFSELESEMMAKISKEKDIFSAEGIEVETTVVVGKRWKTINSLARDYDIDLIVIGSRGLQSASGEINIGTTSHKVAISSPCPVLIVREV